MKFWKSFSKKAVLRQLFFVLTLFTILIPIAIWDSNTQVKVTFDSTELYIDSDKYSMAVPYDIISSTELVTLPEAGEKVADGFDDDIIRTGVWTNSVWGEYYIVADLDVSNCIVLHLNDERIFVFSCKNEEKTAEYFNTLQTYLAP